VSVATSGTHDTEPMVIWWETASRVEREAVLAIPAIARRISGDERPRVLAQKQLSNHCREALLETLFESGSNLLILPIQDVFGWRDRINQPATVGDGNWTWRLPWPVDRLTTEPEAMGIANQLSEWSRKHRR
jgi:4-alpha-glucanotransferase